VSRASEPANPSILTPIRDEPAPSSSNAVENTEVIPAEKTESKQTSEPQENETGAPSEPSGGPTDEQAVQEPLQAAPPPSAPAPQAAETSSLDQNSSATSQPEPEASKTTDPTPQVETSKVSVPTLNQEPAQAPKQDETKTTNAFSEIMPDRPAEPPKQPDEQTEPAKQDESKPADESKHSQQLPIEAFVSSGSQNAANPPQAEQPKPSAPPPDSTVLQLQEPSNPEPSQQNDTIPPAPPNTQAQPQAEESSEIEVPKATESPEQPPDSASTTKQPAPTTNGGPIEPQAREGAVPSSILEKGIIYFFFRSRVNITSPQDVADIARSYLVLRPLPHGAALAEGPIPDSQNARLLALPKKVLPLSGKDRFMVFVEKTKISFSQLKDDFMSASDYATKTAGTSHSPPVTPIAEGIYAITTTGRESHLAYMLTIPGSLGEVQKDVGLRDTGSFVVSAKNPQFPGPANASLDKGAEYPSDIIEEFRERRWMPLQPKLLDYENTQFLLIGESKGLENALTSLPRDEKQDKDSPLKEMEQLEREDEIRVKHLKGTSLFRLIRYDIQLIFQKMMTQSSRIWELVSRTIPRFLRLGEQGLRIITGLVTSLGKTWGRSGRKSATTWSG
jgi:hypothetical protein